MRAPAQQTAFNYQGRLSLNGQEADGMYDARFALYDNSSGGVLISNFQTNGGLVISNGYFITQLDFGSAVFNGGDLWLDIGIRTNGAANFTSLSPRQKIAPTPYAITAANLSGNIPASQITGAVTFTNPANQFMGTFKGDGSGLTNVQALLLTNYPTLNGSNNFTGFSRMAGNVSLVGSTVNPTNVYPGTGSISANYGTQTFTGTGNPFLKFQPGWNFVITNDQYIVINVISPNQVTVFETVAQTYLNQTNWTVYPNGLTLNDINQNHFGWVGNDASIGIIGGKQGGNSGQMYFVQDNHAFGLHMTHQGDGSYLAFDSEGFLNGGSFKISDAAIYDSLVVKPNGLVSMRFGATNEHGTLNLYGAVNAPETLTAGNLMVTGSILGNGVGITNIPSTSIAGLANAITNALTGIILNGSFSGSNASLTNATLYGLTTLNNPSANGVILSVPDRDFIGFGGSNGPGTIRWNNEHSVDGELEIKSEGRIALVPGYDEKGAGSIQMGNPNPTHETIYINTDVNPSGVDVSITGAGTTQTFGPSKLLSFVSGWSDTNSTTHFTQTAIRSETVDRTGTTEQRFYNPSVGGNPIGVGSVNGVEQLAIGTGYVRIDGGQMFGVNTVVISASTNYPIAWTSSIDSIYPAVTQLNFNTQNLPTSGARKEMVLWGQFTDTALTWPTNWVQLTPLPTTLTNQSVGKLTLLSLGFDDSSILAYYTAVPHQFQVDTNAQAFIDAAGLTNPAHKAAIVRLVKDLKTSGIWAKLTAFYPLVGGTASSDRWNLVNTNAFQLAFYNTLYYTNGLRGDGLFGFANTGLSTSNFATSNECLEFINVQDATPPLANANFWSADVYNALAMNGAQYGYAIGPLGAMNAATIYANLPNTNYSGFLGVNVHAGIGQWYTSGANAAGSFSSAGITTTSAIKLFAQPGQNLNYTAAGFGSGFSNADVASLISAIKNFETALGR